jgi:hypothetical protein
VLLLAAGPVYAEEPSTPTPTSQPAAPSSQPTWRVELQRKLEAVLKRQSRVEERLRAERARREALERRLEEQKAEIVSSQLEDLNAAQSRKRLLDLYGFFDVNFGKWWIPDQALFGDMLNKAPVFAFGQLNLYVDSSPHPSVRFLTEIRFLVNPTGDTSSLESKELGTEFQWVSTRTVEAHHFMDQLEYGSIEIERAWVSWQSPFNWLRATAGIFLTPYGVWNIDHGSPTRILASRPLLYTSWAAFFPERQLGIKLDGSFLVGDVQLAYALTLSNGRSPTALKTDQDWDKGAGLRLEAQSSGRLSWKAGLSGYTGDFTDTKMVLSIMPEMNVEREVAVRYREAALGVDLTLEIDAVTLIWEVLANWRVYEDGHRGPADIWGFIPANSMDAKLKPGGATQAPDRVAWGSYGIVAYRLPFDAVKLKPYLHVFYIDFSDNVTGDNILGCGLGVSWRILDPLVLKLEHMFYLPTVGWPEDHLLHGADFIQSTMSQLAVAF